MPRMHYQRGAGPLPKLSPESSAAVLDAMKAYSKMVSRWGVAVITVAVQSDGRDACFCLSVCVISRDGFASNPGSWKSWAQ